MCLGFVNREAKTLEIPLWLRQRLANRDDRHINNHESNTQRVDLGHNNDIDNTNNTTKQWQQQDDFADQGQWERDLSIRELIIDIIIVLFYLSNK